MTAEYITPSGAQITIAAPDSGRFYKKNNKILPRPKPPGPPTHYRWNNDSETWELDGVMAAAAVRNTRDRFLAAVDRVNPIWYASLGVERQVALQEYRQALLAVPEQPGFPDQVIWPTKPSWL
jgi:hypothetical protein